MSRCCMLNILRQQPKHQMYKLRTRCPPPPTCSFDLENWPFYHLDPPLLGNEYKTNQWWSTYSVDIFGSLIQEPSIYLQYLCTYLPIRRSLPGRQAGRSSVGRQQINMRANMQASGSLSLSLPLSYYVARHHVLRTYYMQEMNLTLDGTAAACSMQI